MLNKMILKNSTILLALIISIGLALAGSNKNNNPPPPPPKPAPAAKLRNPGAPPRTRPDRTQRDRHRT